MQYWWNILQKTKMWCYNNEQLFSDIKPRITPADAFCVGTDEDFRPCRPTGMILLPQMPLDCPCCPQHQSPMGEISKSALLTLKRKISWLAQAILICHIRNTSLMHLFIAAFFLKKQLLGSHLKMVQNPPNHYLDTLTLPSENKCTMSTLSKF